MFSLGDFTICDTPWVSTTDATHSEAGQTFPDVLQISDATLERVSIVIMPHQWSNQTKDTGLALTESKITCDPHSYESPHDERLVDEVLPLF